MYQILVNVDMVNQNKKYQFMKWILSLRMGKCGEGYKKNLQGKGPSNERV